MDAQSIAQAAQFVQSGAADAGLISLSLALSPKMKDAGHYWEIPADAYPKLDIVLGHLGETIPFALWRLDWTVHHLTGKSGFADIFRDRFYIEITRHHGGTVGQNEARIEAALIKLAIDNKLPLVATNDVYFGEPDMFDAHDALLCIAGGRLIATVAPNTRSKPARKASSASEIIRSLLSSTGDS